ncbi:MAG: gluconokinase [Leptolyngbyaceae cyanobacterium SM2_3_12]|nr:gluconokinase [Leptolyngbyaceae cyanobacterium SM2_3_12]
MIIIVMGVSGVGKTTIGTLLAQQLAVPFYDGDNFHSAANIAKMRQSLPLTDDDRALWLAALGDFIQNLVNSQQSAVIACSALKAAYRQQLGRGDSHIQFVYLKGDYDLIQGRLNQRQGHFMAPTLLASQFATLEEPEDSLVVDVAAPPQVVVQTICTHLGWA